MINEIKLKIKFLKCQCFYYSNSNYFIYFSSNGLAEGGLKGLGEGLSKLVNLTSLTLNLGFK